MRAEKQQKPNQFAIIYATKNCEKRVPMTFDYSYGNWDSEKTTRRIKRNKIELKCVTAIKIFHLIALI